MELLTRDVILQADDILIEDVYIPEWGGTVRVRGMTGTERDKFESEIVEQDRGEVRVQAENLRAKMLALVCINADGSKLFQQSDIEALGGKSAAALQRLFEVAQRLSGLTEADVEELTKNIDGDQSEDSISA